MKIYRIAEDESIKMVPLSSLRSAYDPNVPLDKLREQERGYLDHLKENIKSNGIIYPIQLIRSPKGELIVWDGMHRLAVAEELGMLEVPIKIISNPY